MVRTQNKIRRHIAYLVMLFLLLAVSFFAFISCQGQSAKQFQIGLVTALAYFFWGLFHHWDEHDLNWIIVIEYVSIAIFGLAVLWALLSFVY